jgi:hypothetical protein
MLAGTSRVTGLGERVTVLTRRLPDRHVVYMLLVVPAQDYAIVALSSDRMMRSLKVDGQIAHR